MNLKKYLVFGLSLFMLPFAHADVMGVFESSARPTEMHVYYRDERHFKLEFVPKGASKPVSYLVASDGNAFLVSSRGGQKLAVDFSDRIQADAECAGSVKFSSQEKQETFAGLEGTAFTVTVKSKKLPDPMVLAKNELAGKVTKAYFHALSTLSNDGKPKPANFLDPLALFACIQSTGYSALLSENSTSQLQKVEQVELSEDFYSLPSAAKIISAP